MGYSNVVDKTKTGEAVTLDEAKEHLNVEPSFTDDDTIISSMISSATRYTESYCGRDIVTTENEKEYIEYKGWSICIEEAPLSSFTSLKTYDEDDNETTLTEGEDYKIQKKLTEFVIRFEEYIDVDRLVIEFTTGDAIGDINPTLKAAILIKMNDLYDMDRTTSTVGVNYNTSNVFNNLCSGFVINRW